MSVLTDGLPACWSSSDTGRAHRIARAARPGRCRSRPQSKCVAYPASLYDPELELELCG